MIRCHVTIKTATGSRSYSGVFPSTMAATIDAMDHLADGHCRISVKVLP